MGQQTNYFNNPPPALAVMVAWQEGEVIWSKVAEGAVGVGLLCAPGAQSLSVPAPSTSLATSGQAGTIKALPTDATDPIPDTDYIGVPILNVGKMATDQVGTATQGSFSYSTYIDKMTVPVLRKGRIWVFSAQATTQYGAVYVYGTAQTNNPTGQFGYGAGTGKILFSRGRWLMTTSGAGLALLEIW